MPTSAPDQPSELPSDSSALSDTCESQNVSEPAAAALLAELWWFA